ncbi:MAG TPA: hypothetical protein VE075_06270, partial [Thermoanaerobaculia bacterium]|nr:hypothetical protein [Thermoanaerobaculia bacterium]
GSAEGAWEAASAGAPTARPWNRAAQTTAPPQLPSVEALADQVMRQIDKRFLAWRERTGRR